MKIDVDDPRLTALAIGELDAPEAAEVEALLENSPEARAEADAIRATAQLLEKEFGAAPELGFTEAQRGEVLAAGKVVRTEPGTFRKFNRWLGVTGVAACLVGVAAIGLRGLLDEDVAAMRDAAGIEASQMPSAPAEADEDGSRENATTPSARPADPSPALATADDFTGKLEDAAEEEKLLVAGATAQRKELAQEVGGSLKKRDGDTYLYRGREQAEALKPQSTPEALSLAPEPAPVATNPSADRASAGLAIAADEQARLRSRAVRESVVDAFAADDAIELAGVAEGAPGAPAASSSFFGEGGVGEGQGGADVRAGVTSAALQPEARRQEAQDSAKKLQAETRGRRVGGSGKALTNEDYGRIYDTPFVEAFANPLSTFAVDVDTASYSNTRRYIGRRSQLPPKDAVRVEELINYFDYDYAEPAGEHPFSVAVEVASCPWAKEHRLVRVGLKGKSMAADKRPASNLIFLVDASGSMNNADKLPLLKKSLAALVRHLNEDDRIGIVTYAANAGVALEPKHGDQKEQIIDAIDKMRPSGGTNGAGGIDLAYKLAKENFVEGGTNRVVLATDGDFNVGTTNTEQLVEIVKARATEDKVFLTVLGFGEGNLKESRMEQIANKGNGNYFYIDNENEGRRVLVDKLSATLVTIAKDVKVQVDFNPAKVHSYRLIGYANRLMAAKDFRRDKVDAGEIGAGHTVTALYEIVPAGTRAAQVAMAKEASRYIRKADPADAKSKLADQLVESEELLTVALRYKAPDAELEDKATEFAVPLVDAGKDWADADGDFRFAAAVAGFGMQLRESDFRGACNYDLLLELAGEGLSDDPNGLRKEFVELVEKAKAISGK